MTTPEPSADRRRTRSLKLRFTVPGVALALALPVAAATPPAAAQAAPPRPAATMRFDFGTAESPVAEGYTQVTERMVFTRARGYGWHEGDEVICRDRERGDALRRDLCFAQWAEFMVDVPNGSYDVTVTMGDATGSHDDVGLLLQGKRVAIVTTAVGEFFVKTFRTSVSAGRFSLVIDDIGGEDVNAVINAVEITPADASR